MFVQIYYNNEIDEFSSDIFIEDRIENYIDRNFSIIKIISTLSEVYLIGGAIRDLIFAKKPKDLDFVVLNNSNMEWLKEVFSKFNIKYTINNLGGLKLDYNDIEIDIWTTNDLYDSIQYNVDGLFYSINQKKLISLTFDDFIQNSLREVNDRNNIDNGRIKKLRVFEKEFLRK